MLLRMNSFASHTRRFEWAYRPRLFTAQKGKGKGI